MANVDLERWRGRKGRARWMQAIILALAFGGLGNAQSSTSITGLQAAATAVGRTPVNTPPLVLSSPTVSDAGRIATTITSSTSILAAAPSPELSPPLLAPSPAYEENLDAEALKILQQGSRNFKQLQTTGLSGWIEGTDPCQGWTGVRCNYDNRVVSLELGNWGMETRLPPELSGLDKLQILNLTGNNLLGGLPSNWGSDAVFPNLIILDLSNNPQLSGALPPVWGTQGAFPKLTTLKLDRTGVSGQLPLAWGGKLSLPSLATLDLGSNILDGALPAGWGTPGAFAELQSLVLQNNSLTGTLPAQWGSSNNGAVFPSLQSLDISNNSVAGYLPNSWGTAFQNLSTLSLANNKLTGQLPSLYTQTSRWRNLTKMDIHNNELSGSIPASWGNWTILPRLTLVLLPGNMFCGALPSKVQAAAFTANGSQLAVDALAPCMVPPSPVNPALISVAAPYPSPAKLVAVPSPQEDSQPQNIAQQPSFPPPLISPPQQQSPPPPKFLPQEAPTPAPAPTLHASISPAPELAPVTSSPPWEAPAASPVDSVELAPATQPSAVPQPSLAPTPATSVAAPKDGSTQLSQGPAPEPEQAAATIGMPPIEVPSQSDTEMAPGPEINTPAPSMEAPEVAPALQQVPAPQPASGPAAVPEPIEVPVEVPASVPEPIEVPVEAPASLTPAPSEAYPTPVPSPSYQDQAQVLARYNLTGPNLVPSNSTVRSALLTALSNTLDLGRDNGIALDSFTSSAPTATTGRRLLLTSDNAQAVFLINTSASDASEVLSNLYSNSTSSRFGQQLGLAGLPSVQPALQEARITNPLVTSPLAPASVEPPTTPPPVLVEPSTQSGGHLSGAAIGGIVAGVAVAVVLVAGLAICFCRRQQRNAKEAAKIDIESPHKSEERKKSFSKSPKPAKDEDPPLSGALDERAARLAAKNRKPSMSPARREDRQPPPELKALDTIQSVASQTSVMDSFEEEEGHALCKLPSAEVAPNVEAAPSAERSGSLRREQRLDSAQSMNRRTRSFGKAVSFGTASPPGTDTPSSDHTAMTSEIVADPLPENANSGSTSGSLGSGDVPSRSGLRSSQPAFEGKKEKSGPGGSASLRRGSAARETPSSMSRSDVFLRVLERQLRDKYQNPPPSSYSRRHTGGEPQMRRTRTETTLERSEVHEKRELPLRTEAPRQKRSMSERQRQPDSARLRSEVEQMLGGGYLRRAGEERAPPPSYHRRLAEDATPSRTASGHGNSGTLSRHGSGAQLSRQASAALSRGPSGGVEGFPRSSSSGQMNVRRQAASGADKGSRTASGVLSRMASGEPLYRSPSGAIADRRGGPSSSADPRPAESRRTPSGMSRDMRGAVEGTVRPGEKVPRRQNSSQREVLLRDLERQLGLEPREAVRGEGRDPRVDGRREIAQRARKLLEELGGLEPGEDLNKQLERLGSRRLRQLEAGQAESRRPNSRRAPTR